MFDSEFIQVSFIIFFITAMVVKLALSTLNIRHIKKHMQIVPEKFKEKISLEDHIKAQKYTLAKSYTSLVSILVHGALLMYWLFGGGLNWLHNELEVILPFNTIWFGIFFIFTYSFINSILSLPLSLYSTFVIEEKFGFNKTTPKLYIIDSLKQFVLSLLIGIPLLFALLSFVEKSGDLWWFYAWAFMMLFQFILIWAYPKFIAPLFNKFSPLDNNELSSDIKNLTDKCELTFKEYYVMNASIRSSHGNAYFTGFGKNKRIVFFDTLIETLSKNEVLAVLAHELGHFKKKHILKSILLGTISMFIGFYILGVLYQSPEFFKAFNANNQESYWALLLFMLVTPAYTFLLTPLSSFFSRKNEYEADTFAAENTDAKDLISALLKMYKDNSSSLTPHPWYSKFYYSHPPADERVSFLESLVVHEG